MDNESNTVTSSASPARLTRKKAHEALRGRGKHSMQQVHKVLARNKDNHGAIAKTLEFFGFRPSAA